MTLFEKVSFKSKIAFVCFVCGKMLSIPAVYFIFAGDKDAAVITIMLYACLVFISLMLSYLDLKSIKQGRNEVVSHFKSIDTDEDATYIVKVVDGKMVIVK